MGKLKCVPFCVDGGNSLYRLFGGEKGGREDDILAEGRRST